MPIIAWRHVIADFFSSVIFIAVVAVTVAVLTSCNDIFWLEAKLKVDGKDTTGSWHRKAKIIEKRRRKKFSCFRNIHMWFAIILKINILLLFFCNNLVITTGYFNCWFQFGFYPKKKQKNKRLLSQLGDSDADITIGQNNQEAQAKSRANAADRNPFLKNTKD